MPEGDTIFRTAAALRAVLVGRSISAARAPARPRTPRPPRLDHLAGNEVRDVRAVGKHLLISFAGGETLRTHLGMSGSWHWYPTGATWQRPERRASVVLETPDAVAVCFDARQLELLPAGAEARDPVLRALGPDLLGEAFDHGEGVARLRAVGRATIGEALLDQRAVAGIGNVYRSEILFVEGIHPRTAVAQLTDEELGRLLTAARRLLRANAAGGPRSTLPGRNRGLWTYGRAGRPCRRCGTRIASARLGEQARWVYWCLRCQPERAASPAAAGQTGAAVRRRSG